MKAGLDKCNCEKSPKFNKGIWGWEKCEFFKKRGGEHESID